MFFLFLFLFSFFLSLNLRWLMFKHIGNLHECLSQWNLTKEDELPLVKFMQMLSKYLPKSWYFLLLLKLGMELVLKPARFLKVVEVSLSLKMCFRFFFNSVCYNRWKLLYLCIELLQTLEITIVSSYSLF